MTFIKKFLLICSIILLFFIQYGYQSTNTSGYSQYSSDKTFEDLSEDITGNDTTVIIENEEFSPETTTFDEITSSSSSSLSPHAHSTTKRPSTHSDVDSTPQSVNTSTLIHVVINDKQSSTTVKNMDPIIQCSAQNGTYGIKHWPPAYPGQVSSAKCPGGKAKWKCLESGYFDPIGPDFSNCTDWLDDLENKDIEFIDEAIKVIEFISNKTVKNDTIKESEKLTQVLNIISKVQIIVDNSNDTNLDTLIIYGNNIVETFTHIMDQKQAWMNSTGEEKATLASKILIGTQSSSYTLSLQQNSSQSVVEIINNDFYINTFYTDPSNQLVFPIEEKNSSTILIPANTVFVNSSVERNSTAIGAIIRNLNGYMAENLEENHEINSEILSFSLTNSSKNLLLNQDVIIKLKHKHRLQFGDSVDCVFWDFNQSKWSSEGCHKLVDESDLLHTVCKCNHLTNFAALMDVQGRQSKTLLKSLLTYFCSIISILGLMLTINLIIRSKHNSQNVSLRGSLTEMRSIITCNLCICLLMTNLLVIVGMDRTDILWLCQMSSALLLYSLLSSFSWMLLEGYFLYKSLVICFKTEFKGRNLYIFGYGFPFTIIIISLIVIYIKEKILLEALFDKRYNYFCWISSTHYPSHIWILIGPAVFVIVCNSILMYISLRTAFKILRSQSYFDVNTDRTEIKFRQIISFVFILFLLGITWLSFLFYIHQFLTSFFTLLFIVLNGSQGFFIFLYHLSIYDFQGNRRASSSSSIQSNLF